MDIVTVIATSVSAASAVTGAVVAIIIVILTAKTVDAYKKQVQIGQNQIHATQEQTYNQARPVLIPPADIQGMMRTEQGRTFLQWGNQSTIEGLQNIGVGPAFTIYGIFFEPPVQNRPPHDRYQGFTAFGHLLRSKNATGRANGKSPDLKHLKSIGVCTPRVAGKTMRYQAVCTGHHVQS